MSNNKWKQYGGRNHLENSNVVSLSTVIATQFISRSAKPGVQIYDGSFFATDHVTSNRNIVGNKAIISNNNAYIHSDIYANRKIYFGNGLTETPTDDSNGMFNKRFDSGGTINGGIVFDPVSTDASNAYIAGDASGNYIGINTVPIASFHVRGNTDQINNVLIVESASDTIHSIISQNKNEKGIVANATDTSANLLFYVGNSTSEDISMANASITCETGDNFVISSKNDLLLKATHVTIESDTSFNVASQNFSISSNANHIFTDNSDNLVIDASGILQARSTHIVFDASESSIEMSNNTVFYNGKHTFDPSKKSADVSGHDAYFNETIQIFDTSAAFLADIFDNPMIYTGTTINSIATDNSANVNIRMMTPNKQGSVFGGGAYYSIDMSGEPERAMAYSGLSNNTSDDIIVSQTIVAGTNKGFNRSTVGINTISPITEDYVLDVNGRTIIKTGDVNIVANSRFEIQSIMFSKKDPLHGVASGTPDSFDISDNGSISDFGQSIIVTTDGGQTWSSETLYESNSQPADTLVDTTASYVFDSSYAMVLYNGALYTVLSENYNTEKNPSIEPHDIRHTINALIIHDKDGTNVIVIVADANGRIYHHTKTVTETYAGLISSIDTTGFVPNTQINSVAGDTDRTNVYFCGSGILHYPITNISTDSEIFVSELSQNNYYDIHAYPSTIDLSTEDGLVIAVGEDAISYSSNKGGAWSSVPAASINLLKGSRTAFHLNSVHIVDSSNAIAVGDEGLIVYTQDGARTWANVPDIIINTSGVGAALTMSSSKLTHVTMSNPGMFCITKLEQSFSGDIATARLGKSRVFFCYLPALFHPSLNNALDVYGNLSVTGEVRFDKDLYVDGTLFMNNQNTTNTTTIYETIISESIDISGDIVADGSITIKNGATIQGDTINVEIGRAHV